MKKLRVVAALILVSVIFAGCSSLALGSKAKDETDHNARMLYWNNSPFINVPWVKDFETLGIVTVVKTVESLSSKDVKDLYHDTPITYAEIMAEVVKVGGDAAVNVVVDKEIIETYNDSEKKTVWVEKFTATALAIKYTATLSVNNVRTDENGTTTTSTPLGVAPVGDPNK
jgi:hypothetical protein